jgi:fatty acid desaturase
MHESAHRLLFSHRAINDFVGTWFLGFVGFTSTAAYRRVHMAHHRAEFGPEEPDLALYANYPISTASFRRKLTRDALGRTGVKLLRQQLRGLRSPEARIRRTQVKIFAVQLMLFAICTALGVPLLYPLMWLLPYLTVWRVINRLRSIAEHGGMTADTDKRRSTHSVHQHVLARFFWSRSTLAFTLPTTSMLGSHFGAFRSSTQNYAAPSTSPTQVNSPIIGPCGGRLTNYHYLRSNKPNQPF